MPCYEYQTYQASTTKNVIATDGTSVANKSHLSSHEVMRAVLHPIREAHFGWSNRKLLPSHVR